ncbi:MAG: ABC transporter permease [Pseudohongiellaceae bacterium]
MREFVDNVKTKGFWISILLLPALLVGMVILQARISDAIPTRYYILIDQTGTYQQAVQQAIDLEYQRRVLQEFVSYLLANRKDRDMEQISADAGGAADNLIDTVDADQSGAIQDWMDNGGLDYALVLASPYLREDAPPFEAPDRLFLAADLPGEVDPNSPMDEIISNLRPYLNGERSISAGDSRGSLFALIMIPENVDRDIIRPGTLPVQRDGTPAGIQYWSRNLTDDRLPNAIASNINREIRDREFAARGVDANLVRNVQATRLPMNRLDPLAAEGEEAVSMADTIRQYAPVGFVYLMFFSLMQSMQYLLSNTVEEKSNRIIEVLLASVTADELMMGKLLGIGLSGLTTIGTWLLSFVLILALYQSEQMAVISQILDVVLGSALIPWFVFYYFAGYALYSGVFLAIGSLCNTLKEAQSMMMPMIMIQVVPLAIMVAVVVDPDNTLFRAMSWFPLFTPYLMMNRMASNPPMFEVIGTTVLLVVSIIFVLWLSGKVFRHGVLRTGQPPRIVELFKLLRIRKQSEAL